ncbi:MAG: 16S rRNA (cytosine(1402)-N(4))-methyltransferase RsmH [Pyrinomonadaceae bacterium]
MPFKKVENLHQSVLLAESIRFLQPENGGVFIDATLGLGGHTEAILTAGENARVIGIDQDREAIKLTRKRLKSFGHRLNIYHANFSEIGDVSTSAGHPKVDGILADLGVSSLQFDSPERGFSFRFDAPLDMRMDAGSDRQTAAELLAELPETEIARIIFEYGEERFSRRIARRIVEKRERGQAVRTTGELAGLVERAVRRSRKDKIHPATRTFQALRIAVNSELEILEKFIRDSADLLKPGGRMCLITFHSLEDRIVKRTFQKLAGKCFCPPKLPVCICGAEKKIEILTRKPVLPEDSELSENPRSRSAKLRACLKLN